MAAAGDRVAAQTEPAGAVADTAVADTAVADTAAADSAGGGPGAVVPAAPSAPGAPGFFGSPTGIMLRSLVVPGWGQATNGSWIKAGVVVAVEGLMIASIVRDSAELEDLAAGSQEYEDVYNQRQQTAWWLGAAVFLSMIDAYVDAHLKSGDVELGPEPTAGGLSLAARVRWP